MKKLLLSLLILFTYQIIAQTAIDSNLSVLKNQVSIHQQESEKYASYNLTSDNQWDSLRFYQTKEPKIQTVKSSRACNLTKRVYGWHPYWQNGLQSNYNWSGLSDLSYFSYEVNATDGNAITTHGWSTAQVVTDAQANGVNVTLCVTLFANHSTFLGNATAQQTLITNLINAVQSRNAKGINIDFEAMASANKIPFTNFMINLCNQMHTAIPNSEVSLALYAVDWNNVYDVGTLNPFVDLFIIMGYDYYWSGSSIAGPESPLYNYQTSYNYTLSKSITSYLNKGVSKNKLLLGLPYYGREWSTTALTIPSSTTGNSNSVTYRNFRINANGYYSNRQWDANSFSSWFPSTRTGTPWQAFVDDTYSMGKRFDLVNQSGIGGIGIWALGYDDGYNDFWNLIEDKFSTCATVACTDTIYDMGGPNRNYYDNENYIYTIEPTNADSFSLNFSTFNVQLNNDSLWIYDGPSINAPLIGIYTGTNNPGQIISSGNSLTIKFKSNNTTTSTGWQAIWQCITDVISPTTQINGPTGWVTQNFTTTFNDIDNNGGSGIDKSFYQVTEFDGTEWRSNNANGFFNDDFNTSIHSDWTTSTGTWAINGGYLNQTDQTTGNSNIYASLAQDSLSNYLYQWQGKIDGTGNNRRAGLYIFCDSASKTQRGNAYMVWFRVDQSSCEFYRSTNNSIVLVHSVPMTVQANQWYDYKVIYNPTSGEIRVYQNNNFVGNWIDSIPLKSGNAISFRSGNSDYMVNDLRVYRSRNSSEVISVGAATTNDVRYQNPNPSTPSGAVNSITKDIAGNLSPVATQNFNIDWTPPSITDTINDSLANDIAISYSATNLSANWTSSTDTNSAIANYWYAIGTTSGATDVVNWTNNGLNKYVTATGLNLINGQIYYYSVKAEDGAGLQSNVNTSNGQIAQFPLSIYENNENNHLTVFPNPFSNNTSITYSLSEKSNVELSLMDVLGKKIILVNDNKSQGIHTLIINASDFSLSPGMYFIVLKKNNNSIVLKIILH